MWANELLQAELLLLLFLYTGKSEGKGRYCSSLVWKTKLSVEIEQNIFIHPVIQPCVGENYVFSVCILRKQLPVFN